MDVLHGFLATRETGPASRWNGNVALFVFSLFQDPGRGLVCIIASKPRSWNRSRLVHILCPWKDHTESWKNHPHQVKILASSKRRRFSISGEPEITSLVVLKSFKLLFGSSFIYSHSPHPSDPACSLWRNWRALEVLDAHGWAGGGTVALMVKTARARATSE